MSGDRFQHNARDVVPGVQPTCRKTQFASYGHTVRKPNCPAEEGLAAICEGYFGSLVGFRLIPGLDLYYVIDLTKSGNMTNGSRGHI